MIIINEQLSWITCEIEIYLFAKFDMTNVKLAQY
jgi:hypothetical protein